MAMLTSSCATRRWTPTASSTTTFPIGYPIGSDPARTPAAEPVRRLGRRADHQEQDVLLLQLRRHKAAADLSDLEHGLHSHGPSGKLPFRAREHHALGRSLL